MLQKAGMIAPDGRCKTMDAAADGYVRAETCRAIYLMPTNLHGMTARHCARSQLGIDPSHEAMTDVATCVSNTCFHCAGVLSTDAILQQKLHLHDCCAHTVLCTISVYPS